MECIDFHVRYVTDKILFLLVPGASPSQGNL